jgi:hypothetical protein
MEVYISQMHSEDFSSIAKEIGRSETACLVHLKKMLRNGLSKEEMEGLIKNWSKPETDCDANIPTEYTLPQLCDMEGMTNNFSKNLNNNRIAIHITQIPPDKLATFDKDIYLKTNETNLDDNEKNYIAKLDGEKRIMPDNTARILHNFDENMGGAENPHICHPETRVYREFIHGDVFVSNNTPGAILKYRTANDRKIHYGNGRGRFSHFCYGYIFKASDLKRAKFIDVGIGRNQFNAHECTGQSPLPVMPRGCYKITYNGMGIQNATATWVPL